jgi:hypothetical protein
MPRKRRTQPGTSGGAYSNRADLAQPVQAPSGLAYGERQALEEAQAAQPLPAQVPFDRILAAAQGHQFSPVSLNAPSTRPNEPVTHGLSVGPGGGPEVLAQSRGLSDVLARAVAESGNEVLAAMLDNARRMGL